MTEGLAALIISILTWVKDHLALIISGISAIAAWVAVIVNRKSSRGQLYAKLFEEYASPEMSKALRLLRKADNSIREYQKKRGFRSEDNYLELWQQRLAYPDKVEDARRFVKYYFVKILRLKKAGFLSRKLMEKLGAVYGINLLYDVVRKGEEDPQSRKEIDEIKEICGHYPNKKIKKRE